MVVPLQTPHADYWRGHSLPVVIALVDPRTQLVYWQHVNETTLVDTGEHWKIHVPAAQTLDPTSAHILGLPARTAPDRDAFQTALDALPGEARDNLLRAHADNRPHALPLATHLAHAPKPKDVVTRLLDDPPHWMPLTGHSDASAATSTIMAYAVAHRLGFTALRTIETAADAARQPARAARLRALAAAPAIEQPPTVSTNSCTPPGNTARYSPPSSDPSPTRTATTPPDSRRPSKPPSTPTTAPSSATPPSWPSSPRPKAPQDTTTKPRRSWNARWPSLPPTRTSRRIWRRPCCAATPEEHPTNSFWTATGPITWPWPPRAEIRRWSGPSGRAAHILLHARSTNHDTDGALRTAIAQPAGEALPHELEHPALRLDAARLAYRSGRPELAREIEQGIDDEGLRTHLAAIALEADAATDHQARVLAWTTAAEAAQDDEQRVTAAMELAALGVWPLSDLTRLRDLGHVPPMTYDIHHAAALTAQGDTTAAIRVLRRWENTGAAAALALTDTYARADMWLEAARACERAGIRFGDINQRLAAVGLWRRADDPVQARLQALTLLSRPLLPIRARRHLRHEVLAWAREREDWVDTEDHAWAGIWEESGVHDLDDAPPTPLPPRAAAFAWVAIHAQINARRLDAAEDTNRRFRPSIENPDQARMWLLLKAETGWDTTAAEQGLDLADRFRTDTRLSEEIAGAMLGATAGPADPNSSDRPERLDLTEGQVDRL
ncbi:DUF4365 domain-containing protein, partial [Streptomyces sp. SID3343]|nr:DUF4365 domain-containing protein [Streptomyces sp. SID3343]